MKINFKTVMMTMTLLISTTSLYAASVAGDHTDAAAHGGARMAAAPGHEWGDLRLEGVFTGINPAKLPDVISAMYEHIADDRVHEAIFRMQEPVPETEIMANIGAVLGRLRQGPEASDYFTPAKIKHITSHFSLKDSAEAMVARVGSIVAEAPISDAAKEKVRTYLARIPLVGYFQEALDKAAGIRLHTSEPWKAQIAYSLVSQVALGDQAIKMQRAGGYDWMHNSMILKPEVLNPVRQALWKIFVDTRFVTSPIGNDLSHFVYNPANAIMSYLADNPGVRDIVIACGHVPVLSVPYEVTCHTFFGSMGCLQSHAGQLTIALDYRDRPTVFANALEPGLFDLVGKGRINNVIIEADSSSLVSPGFIGALRAALGDDVLIQEGRDGDLSPL